MQKINKTYIDIPLLKAAETGDTDEFKKLLADVSMCFCGSCGVEVLHSDRAICCDMCCQWFHVSCDASITDSEYNNLVLSPSDDTTWYCSLCNCHVDSTDTTSSLVLVLCVCLLLDVAPLPIIYPVYV